MEVPRIEDLQSPELLVRLQTGGALVAAGDSSWDALLAALQHVDSEVRWRAVVALGWLGDARAVEPLRKLLHGTPYEVKINAAWALGQINDTRAADSLLDLFRTEATQDPDAAYNAALALLRLGIVEPLLHDLDSPQEDAVRVASAALASRPYVEEI